MASFPRGGDVQKGSSSSLSFSHNDELFGTANERQGRLKRIESKSTGVKRKSSSLSSSSSASGYSMLSSRFGTTEAKHVVIEQTNVVDRLRKSSFVENTISLGYVLQVNEDSALISLPGGLTGMVEYAEISDYHYKVFATTKPKEKKSSQLVPISDLLSINQPVRCFTLGQRQRANSKKQSLMLSLRSSLINRGVALKHLVAGFIVYGTVSSVEDHGFIIATGISGVTCFLSSKHISKGVNYSLGQPVECIVDSVNEEARTISVKARSSLVSNAITIGSQLTLTSIIPGMLVNAVVEKVLKVHCGYFLTSFLCFAFLLAEYTSPMIFVIVRPPGVVLYHPIPAHIEVPSLEQQTTNCSSIPRVMLCFIDVAYYITEQHFCFFFFISFRVFLSPIRHN